MRVLAKVLAWLPTTLAGDRSELLLLTDDGHLAHALTDPRKKTWKTYLAQVEGEIDEIALAALRSGVTLKDGPSLPARARGIREPDVWPRQTLPDCCRERSNQVRVGQRQAATRLWNRTVFLARLDSRRPDGATDVAVCPRIPTR